MKRTGWFPWLAGGAAAVIVFGPGGRYLAATSWGLWTVLFLGVFLGYGLAGWVGGFSEDERELLRRRLIRGEIRLSEYRLLCKELGIPKNNSPQVKKEEEFSAPN